MWAYITLFAAGIIIGMVIQWFLVRNRINSTEISVRKVKQKRTTDSTQDVTNKIEGLVLDRKTNRKNKRAIRKQNKY